MNKSLRIAGILNFFFNAYYWILQTFLPILLSARGVSDIGIGGLISAYSSSAMVVMLPMGLLADRIKSKRLMVTAVLIQAIFPFCLLYFPAKAYPFLFMASGAAYAMFLVSLNSSFYRTLPEENRGSLVGFFVGAGVLGYGMGPFVGGLVVDRFGYFVMFVLVLVINLVCLFLMPMLSDGKGLVVSFRSYAGDLAKPVVRWTLALQMIFSSHSGIEMAFLSLFLLKNIHLSRAIIGIFFSAIGLYMFVLLLILGHRFDKRPRPMLLAAIGFTTSGIFQIATGYTHDFWTTLAVRYCHTFGDALIMLITNVLTSVAFSKERMGVGFGLMQIVRMGTIAGISPIGGWIASSYGYPGAFAFSGSITILFALILFAAKPNLPHSYNSNDLVEY